jgi:hypothetical protein
VRGLRLEQKRITESELTLGESLLCVGNWFKDKSQKQQQNPTCNPETDKIWHPHIGNLVRYRVKDLFLPQN